MRVFALAVGVMTLGLTHGAMASDYENLLNEVVAGPVAQVVNSEAVWSSVAQQNTQTADYTQDQIDQLDAQWRAEVDAAEKPLIDEVMARPLSNYLKSVQDESNGVITEIFVVDAMGLNVGQSAVTSDYWQGDEAKWQVPYNTGGVELGEVELDDSTGAVQSQVSVPVRDDEGAIIGTATFAVRVDQ
ncbi:PDC sensor domain-containing protein [Maritalea sp. S77]|uniref:PDC sensor domain-containing protein n=1 Tax=Maritalea sp. S77 TaxID=3415125 RepID=UPI003C7A0C9C